MDWDEAIQEEIFGYALEPVEQSDSGDWEYAGGEEEDVYEIVGFSTEESLKGYFDANNLVQSGEIFDDYYDEYDDHGTHDGEYPGDGYEPGDGYSPGDDYEDHNDSYGGVPVFYLSTVELEDLTGVAGLLEGHYGVEKYMDWDEETQEEIFGYALEPVDPTESGYWEYAGGDEEDGYEIVGFSTEESLKGYFETNNLVQEGYYDEYDDHGTHDGEYPGDGYEPGDGYSPGDDYEDHNDSYGGIPVFYLSTVELEDLTGVAGLPAGNYAVEEYMYDEAIQEEIFGYALEPVEQSDSGDWEYAFEEEDVYEIVGFSTEESLKGYFDANNLVQSGEIFDDYYDEYDDNGTHDGEYPGDGYEPGDGYSPGDDYEDHSDSYGGVPVFYLSTVELEDLTGVAGLLEGHYGVEKYMDWDEETQEEIFGYALEPVDPTESGYWEYDGGDEEDGYEIVGFSTEESLKGYFETNNLVQSGRLL